MPTFKELILIRFKKVNYKIHTKINQIKIKTKIFKINNNKNQLKKNLEGL